MKGYVLDKPRNWSVPDEWSVERLKSLTPQQLAEILPANASYVALLFVEHIASSNQVVHSSADAKVSAMILHQKFWFCRMAKRTAQANIPNTYCRYSIR